MFCDCLYYRCSLVSCYTVISSVLMIWFLSQSSQQEAMKQKEELKKEVSRLRSELQQIRDDRDNLSVQVQRLTSEFDNYKELTTKSIKDLDKITIKTIALEVCFI